MSRKPVAERYKIDPSYGQKPRWGALYRKFFPAHTCGASRHARIIAEDILRNPRSHVRQWLIDSGYEDPDHWASSIEATVIELWSTRAELERVRERKPNKDDIKSMRAYLGLWERIKGLKNQDWSA